jgi:hypothetical protein
MMRQFQVAIGYNNTVYLVQLEGDHSCMAIERSSGNSSNEQTRNDEVRSRP